MKGKAIICGSNLKKESIKLVIKSKNWYLKVVLAIPTLT